MYFTNVVKNKAGSGYDTSHTVRRGFRNADSTVIDYCAINVSGATVKLVHIEVFYSRAGSHFGLIVSVNSHNILPLPQLLEALITFTIDFF